MFSQLLGKDKEGNDDKRVLAAFKEFLADVSKSTRFRKNTPTSANIQNETSYPLLSFVIGISNKPNSISSTLASGFVHKLEILQPSNQSQLLSILRMCMAQGQTKVENTKELENWVANKCGIVNKSIGDLNVICTMAARYYKSNFYVNM